VTSSVGVTIYPTDGADRETLIKNADMAMYQAKNKGKNNYQIFTPDLSAKVSDKMEMQKLMRKAIENNEFVVYYQPKVDMDTNDIVGMEALVRWRRQDGTIIVPDDFIPLAEETGLIVPIGERVLFEACERTKKWHDNGHTNLTVSVNVSSRQFEHSDLPSVVASTLGISELQPQFLCLEITESAMIYDIDKTTEALHKLRALGVGISIDDFGTGYSSLSQLKKLPIGELKIDRSFVKNITNNLNDAAIAKSIISLARTLGLKVIAEGVETRAQLAFLQTLGCDEMQGYLFSPPVPEDSFQEILEKRRENS